jgi:hypothetical protein
MDLFLTIPENPLELVRGHWLLERLADMDLSPDPGKFHKIFTATISPSSIIADGIMRGPIYPTPKGTPADHVPIEHPKIAGKKAAAAYEKAAAIFQKAAADKTLPDNLRRLLLNEAERLTKAKIFQERTTGLRPMFYETPIAGRGSMTTKISIQAYLLFELLKPLAGKYNEGGKEITNSKIHVFIAELLARFYREFYNEADFVPAKIKVMIKNVRESDQSSRKTKLKKLLSIIE